MSDSIDIKKDTIWKAGTFVFAALFIMSLFGVFGGGSGTGTGNAVAPTNPTPSPTPAPSAVKVSTDDDARLGSEEASVEVIEFSDFQCPFCSRVAPTMKQIVDEYGDQVSFVYRDFPLESIHPMALPSAIAAECVKEQGGDEAYFEYHDKLFENQRTLSNSNLKSWAQDLGYDISSCLDSQKYLDEVKKDLSDGQSAGVRGTPATFINGKIISGACPYNTFSQAIDAELAGEDWGVQKCNFARLWFF